MFNPELYSLIQKKSGMYLASSLYDGLEDNNMNQVKALLKEKDADPNILIPSYGISPFHLVIGNESEAFAEEVTKLFLRHGGDPNVRSIDRMTPVHVAAAWGRVRVLELLLANGGDPLCVDDENHTPFHYALEGSFYEAVSVLAKFSCKTQDDDEDSNSDSDKPKVQITLEKIFINNGNVVAEYVPSDIDFTNHTVDEKKQNTKNFNDLSSYKSDGSSSYNLPDDFSVQKAYSYTTNDDSFDNLPNDNITFRRRPRANRNDCVNKNAISPILPDDIVSELKSGFIRDEQKLVKNIIKRLSNSFEKTTGSWANKKLNDEMKNKHTKKFVSLLPQPKIFKNNLQFMNKKQSKTLLDTSIISKSPNFHININRNYNNKFNTSNSLESESLMNQMSLSQSSTSSSAKSASSTPRKETEIVQCKSKEKKCLNNNINRNSLNLSYNERDYVSSFSTNNEYKSDIDDSYFLKNIIRNLNDSFEDDYDKENSELINSEILMNNRGLKLNGDSKKNLEEKTKPRSFKGSHLLLPSKNLKENTRDRNVDKHSNKEEIKQDKELNISFHDKIKSILESPGSSTPTSNYLSVRSELSDQEELDLHYEINNIFKGNKTPPASISKRSDESWATDESTALSDDFTNSLLIYKPSIDTSYEYESSVQSQKDSSNNQLKVEDKMQSSDTDTYETPLRSFSSSTSNDSFVTVEEQYHYVDPERKKAFLERRLCVIPKLDEPVDHISESSYLEEMSENNESGPLRVVHKPVQGKQILANCDLRNRLITLGEQPGPITSTTYHVYLKRLTKLEKNVDLNARMQELSLKDEIKLSPVVKNGLFDPWACNLQPFQDLEDRVFKEFETPKPNRRYRGGISKSYFNYILLDPRITNNLPRNGRYLSPGQRWNIFLKAIFYIGKGKASRPAAHLYDAFDFWFKNKSDEPSNKIQKILDIWRESKGVICLHVYMNRMQEEAFTREAAMIDAIGLDKLTNCVRGNYYGIITTMNNLDKIGMGNYLLYKAMEIFMYEGERQLFPQSIT
ncbi:GSCOCG00000978001-RA-CDS [Cotesia congregata]|nr:GSCOCG00000978001-RA-CDS [Cotesia congregata]